jgi:hypothetical protein
MDTGQNKVKPSNAWKIAGLAGLVITGTLAVLKTLDDYANGRNDVAIGNGMSVLGVVGIPFVVVTWILWLRRLRRLPSLACMVTLLTGCAFFLFSSAESIGGFTTRPIDWGFAIGGMMEVLCFSLPFFIIAWLLWVRPKIGAVLLICLGLVMGTWMLLGWRMTDWVIPSLLVFIPIVLGVFTFIREMRSPTIQSPKPG